MSKLLSKAAILTAKDIKTEVVDVPEWGGAVTVRMMTGADRDAFENSVVVTDSKGNRKTDLTNVRSKLIAMTVVDEAGELMFTAGELDAIGRKSASALDRIAVVARRLNGMGADSVENAEKN